MTNSTNPQRSVNWVQSLPLQYARSCVEYRLGAGEALPSQGHRHQCTQPEVGQQRPHRPQLSDGENAGRVRSLHVYNKLLRAEFRNHAFKTQALESWSKKEIEGSARLSSSTWIQVPTH